MMLSWSALSISKHRETSERMKKKKNSLGCKKHRTKFKGSATYHNHLNNPLATLW